MGAALKAVDDNGPAQEGEHWTMDDTDFKDGDGGGGPPLDMVVKIETCDNGYFLNITEDQFGVLVTEKLVFTDYALLMARLAEVLKPM